MKILPLKNDDFGGKQDGQVSKRAEICSQNEELCIKNQEFCIKNDELCRSWTRLPTITDNDDEISSGSYTFINYALD